MSEPSSSKDSTYKAAMVYVCGGNSIFYKVNPKHNLKANDK